MSIRSRSAAFGLAVVATFVAGALLAPRPAAEGQAPGKGWEYRLFLIEFEPTRGEKKGPLDPGPAAETFGKITADGWEPAGFQVNHSRRAWLDWPSSHVLFKRIKK